MRFSTYNFGSLLKDNRFFVIGHGVTGAVDKVDAKLGEAIVMRRGEECGQSFLADYALSTVESLIKRGYLTQLTKDEEVQRFIEIATSIHSSELANTSVNYMLIPTYKCNLRCAYCFQSHDMHTGKGEFEREMSREQVDAVFQIIEQSRRIGSLASKVGLVKECDIREAPLRRSRLTLFGGEPLQRCSRNIVEYILELAIARGDRLSAVTNGVELADFQDLLGPGLIEELQITLDGPMDLHDKRRIGPAYSRTFEIISSNVELALRRGVQTSLRLNIDSRNPDAVDHLNTYFAERGWNTKKNFMSYAAVVHDVRPFNVKEQSPHDEVILISPKNTKFKIMTEAELAKRTEALCADNEGCIGSYESFANDFLRNALGKEDYPFVKTSHCSAESGLLIFDPLWNVYTCWEEAGISSRKVAEYSKNGLNIDTGRLLPWLSRHPAAIQQCSECPYALIHTSGCGKHAYDVSGHLFSAACESFQDYFPSTLAAAYSRVEKGILSNERSTSG